MRVDAPWLLNEELQCLLAALSPQGEEARINGGAVRNAILEEPIGDIDISTTMLPEDVTHALTKVGFKVVPTGIDHGTVTAVHDGTAYEVTTLRQDIATDGRHAKVKFGRDWTRDAERRDFTMNALYMGLDGELFDPLGGFNDVMGRRLKFIGDPDQRIAEDHLRILRFFRFYAWYGQGSPDPEGLKACARHKLLIKDLSVERVWSELAKMLAAPDPSRSILWMRTVSVLSTVLPESEKWGIDALRGVVYTGNDLGWEQDAMLRLMAIIPPREELVAKLGKRLKMANRPVKRLVNWTRNCSLVAGMEKAEFERHLYRGDQQGIVDTLRLELSAMRFAARTGKEDLAGVQDLKSKLEFALNWQKPEFPLKGKDLLAKGYEKGPKLGGKLAELEEMWVVSQFKLSGDELLQRL